MFLNSVLLLVLFEFKYTDLTLRRKEKSDKKERSKSKQEERGRSIWTMIQEGYKREETEDDAQCTGGS